MLIENKEKIQHYLERLQDKYLTEVIEYLRFLEFKSKNKIAGKSQCSFLSNLSQKIG